MVLKTECPLDSGNTRPTVNQDIDSTLFGASQTQGGKTVFQKLQMQKMKLSFLRRCIKLKRPPPSLRVKGAPIIPDSSKLRHFSVLETLMLGEAIKTQLNEVKRLFSIMKAGSHAKEPLDKKAAKEIQEKHQKKLDFYMQQDETEWKNWPTKSEDILQLIENNKKRVNFKNRKHRVKRRIERQVKKLVAEGSVVILVPEQIPPGAICVLGKGLGYVPTPSLDKEGSRLDMRLTTNRIMKSSSKSLKNTNPS